MKKSRRKHTQSKKFRDANNGNCNISMYSNPYCQICRDKVYKSISIPKRKLKKFLESDTFKEHTKRLVEELDKERYGPKTMKLPKCCKC